MRKLLLLAGTLVLIAVGAASFAAFESHLIDVRAHVEKATYTTPDDLNFGITIMQASYDKSCNPETNPTGTNPPECMAIHLSDSFLEQTQYSGVGYALYCEDKPVDDPHRAHANITPFMLISDSDPADRNDSVVLRNGCGGIGYGASGPTLWAMGVLDKGFDQHDLWDTKFFAPVCSNNYNPETDPVHPDIRPVPLVIDSSYCHRGPGPNDDEYVDLASNVKFQVWGLRVPAP